MNSHSWLDIRESRCTEHPYYAQTGHHQGQQVYSHLPNAPWANVRNFPGSPGILRATNGGLPTSCQATTATRTGSGAPSHEPRPSTHAPPSRRRKAPSAPARERRSGSWLAQRTSPRPRHLQGHRLLVPRRGHHVLAERAPDLAEAQSRRHHPRRLRPHPLRAQLHHMKFVEITSMSRGV
jgi:hypothetical protein